MIFLFLNQYKEFVGSERSWDQQTLSGEIRYFAAVILLLESKAIEACVSPKETGTEGNLGPHKIFP